MKKGNCRKKCIILTVCITVVLFAVLFAALFFFGILHFNNPDSNEYPIFGVDVSSYQGDIDWQVLSKQNIRFAFIKATEGSSLVDRCFLKNWAAAAETDLRIGAYHFFSFESSGEAQAKLFCATVESVGRMLPPVIDVEYYGAFRSKTDIDLSATQKELRTLIEILTDNYSVKPILYCDSKTYGDIIQDDFTDCDLWYRSVYAPVPSGTEWTFWQYSNRHVLKGYAGAERYIDADVFAGSAEEFERYPEERRLP